jgi:disulfide bond formation protein DsbB
MKKSIDEERSFFDSLFLPKYDELTLYAMSYICILFFLVNFQSLSWNFTEFSFEIDSFLLIILFLILISGLFLGIFHAFTNREKTLIEKKLMLIFAALFCGFSGIWGGTYMLIESPGWLIAFPIWNIINGWILISALKGGSITEENVSDENVSINQVILSTAIISTVFFFCYLVINLNWAATLSICLTWVTSLNGKFNATLTKDRIKTF